MKRLLVVYNPRSGRKAGALPELLRNLPRGAWHTTVHDLAKGSLETLPMRPLYDCAAAVGGDGTVSYIVQFLISRDLDIPLAILPRGSANLVARALKLPGSAAACARILEEGASTEIDIGRLSTGEYFIAAFSAGYVSTGVLGARQATKNRIGFGGYIFAFIRQTTLPLHEFHFFVNKTEYRMQGHSLFVVNAASILGLQPKRTVDLRDGAFELVVTTNRSFLSLPKLLYDFYFRRQPSKHFFLTRGSQFVIDTRNCGLLQLDGEPLAPRDRAEITVLPKRQKILVQKNSLLAGNT